MAAARQPRARSRFAVRAPSELDCRAAPIHGPGAFASGRPLLCRRGAHRQHLFVHVSDSTNRLREGAAVVLPTAPRAPARSAGPIAERRQSSRRSWSSASATCVRPFSSSTNMLPPRRSSVSHITSDTLESHAGTPRSACAKRAGSAAVAPLLAALRRRMHVGCHRRRYEVAAARGRAGAAPASAALCWISRTRNASTMSLTPRISANAATQATSRMALRP
jgi:hypothetical protein